MPEDRDLTPWILPFLQQYLPAALPAGFPTMQLIPGGMFAWYLGFMLRRYGVVPRGVVHVGAHRGEELLPYVYLGFRNILLVEAHPDLCAALAPAVAVLDSFATGLTALAGEKAFRLRLENCAAGRTAGQVSFYETRHTALSSTHRPLDAPEGNPASITRELVVPQCSLDALVAADPAAAYNVLRLNIQGAELDALAGSVALLVNIDFIWLEVNLDSRYQLAPTLAELDAFLVPHGLHRVRLDRLSPEVGHAVYLRTSVSG